MGEPIPDRDIACNPLGGGQWMDGYIGQPVFIFEEFVGAASHWSLNDVLRLLDQYRIQVPFKGGFIGFTPRIIHLTTNIHPTKWYDYAGREEQLAALQRRFTCIHYWGRQGRKGLAYNPGQGQPMQTEQELQNADEWDRFWAGPSTTQRLDGPRVGVRVQTLDDYDFMFELQ